jgi:hypothetical protein
MKVIFIVKNIMIHEYQHSGEVQFIQVMNRKMLPSQFESIAFVIRRRLSRFLYFHTKTGTWVTGTS